MANAERNIEHPVNNSKITDKIVSIYHSEKQNKQVESCAVKYAESALMYYWRYKPQTEEDQQTRISEITRWESALEWFNAGDDKRLITALTQDANHLKQTLERNQYEFGVALGNIAALLEKPSSNPSVKFHKNPNSR